MEFLGFRTFKIAREFDFHWNFDIGVPNEDFSWVGGANDGSGRGLKSVKLKTKSKLKNFW